MSQAEDVPTKGLVSGAFRGQSKSDFDYPTPNPSSSLGYLPSSSTGEDYSRAVEENKENISPSSPQRVIKKYKANTLPLASTASFNAQVRKISKVLNIDPTHDCHVSVGRSTKLSQFTLNPHNKLMSRVHCIVDYISAEHKVQLYCKGWNGLNVTVPGLVDVKAVKDNVYSIEPKGLDAVKSDRVLFEDPQFTNFYILKGETINLPVMESIVMDIRGEVVLIEFSREGDNELAMAVEDSKEVNETKDEDEEVNEAKEEDREVNEAKEVIESKEAEEVNEAKEGIESKEAEVKKVIATAPIKSQTAKAFTETPNKIVTKVLAKIVTAQKLKANANSKESSKEPPHEHHKRVRKAYIREEEKEEKDLFEHMTTAQIQSVLKEIPGLKDITHVLTNHIAYSRLLQVPLSDLLSLNPVKEGGLTRLQLRCVLVHHISCVGLIYRPGTDAAGLPLDEEYYYIPEKDEDKSRVTLVEELKGSASHLRSCRKTHKQYFWKRPKK
ncbi:hypothetical protein FOA43_001560 [Brettanomyces nanus]|uniref:FHA domain-containing protein n=1 Tax=Eeniella nana TaxID=13502 RepID=A0A875S1M9_EENNA|nr:uncharacterized protein FOA43_001560 [Brettanomyces nanus]QPG74235.1 hypothetical protein FOA43_001560 [Brettanomyces nanus]